jgi:hypothetical protein
MCVELPNSAEELVKMYIAIRDEKAELKAKQAEAMKPYDDALYRIERKAMEVLETFQSESIKTKAGTMYRSTRTSAKVTDRQALLDYVKEHDDFDLLDIKANKTAVDEFLTQHQELPPGVATQREAVVGFRRS